MTVGGRTSFDLCLILGIAFVLVLIGTVGAVGASSLLLNYRRRGQIGPPAQGGIT